MPPEILSSYKPDQFSSQLKLERSKTDRPRRSDLLPEEAAQFYDEKISVQQKVNHCTHIDHSLREWTFVFASHD